MTITTRACAALTMLAFGAGCATTPTDYRAYIQHMPRSILVLPPLNESPEVLAPYTFLSTITRPLAERGYYVFPVAVVDAMMKDNGLPTPGEMHQVSLEKIDQIIGADAVLYVTIEDWGSEYKVLASVTTVTVRCRLVDVKSGAILWQGRRALSSNSNGGAGGGGSGSIIGHLIVALIGAAVSQVASDLSDESYALSRTLNTQMIFGRSHGFLPGRYHPEHEAELRRRRRLPAE